MTITLELTPDMEQQLQKAAQAQGQDIAAFLLESANRKLRSDVLPETEARLLQRINAPLDPEARQQRGLSLAEIAQQLEIPLV